MQRFEDLNLQDINVDFFEILSRRNAKEAERIPNANGRPLSALLQTINNPVEQMAQRAQRTIAFSRAGAHYPLPLSSSAIDFNGSFRDRLHKTERGIFAPRYALLP